MDLSGPGIDVKLKEKKRYGVTSADDETLPIINKPKDQKKRWGEYKEQNWRTHVEEDKKTT